MPKYGAHGFLWVGDWTTEDGNRAIRAAGEAGFDFIEIPMLRPDEFDAASHKAALDEAGIGSTISLTLPEDAHMPTAPEKAKDFLRGAMDKMEVLGSKYLAGCIAYHLGTMTGQPPTQAEYDVVAKALGEVAAEAKDRGITLSLEVCNRYETYLFNSLQSAYDVIKASGSDNIEIHADTYHMNIEEEGYHDSLVATKDLLGYMHMSESHRGLVGSGTVKWDEVFQGLKDADYKGPLVLESFAAINEDLLAATKLWRPPNQPSDVLASEGLKFLRENAQKVGL